MPVIAFKDFGKGTGERNEKIAHSSILKINPCDLVLPMTRVNSALC